MPEITRLTQLRREGGWFPLGGRAKALVTGTDAQRYLSGQLSNDVGNLRHDSALPALLLTAKGKLTATVIVKLTEAGYLVESEPALREELIARLEKYVVADDVTIEDISTEDAGWHCFGSCSENVEGIRVDRLGVIGRDCPALPAGAMVAEPGERELLRIERGIPTWGAELNADTLPHEAGLDRTHVDFHKGCYVGQETVSRIESVGRTNRLLRGFVGDFSPLPGAILEAGGQHLGTITSAARHFELASGAALGYLNTRTTEVRFAVTSPSGEALGECHIHEFPLV